MPIPEQILPQVAQELTVLIIQYFQQLQEMDRQMPEEGEMTPEGEYPMMAEGGMGGGEQEMMRMR